MSSNTSSTTKIPAIIRPSAGATGQATFIWVPGVNLVELVNQRGELKFAIWDGRRVQYQNSHEGYTPPKWVSNAVKKCSVRLPSEATPFGSLDQLAQRMKAFVHKYLECDEAVEDLSVLYALQSWAYERFRALGYLRFQGIWGT